MKSTTFIVKWHPSNYVSQDDEIFKYSENSQIQQLQDTQAEWAYWIPDDTFRIYSVVIEFKSRLSTDLHVCNYYFFFIGNYFGVACCFFILSITAEKVVFFLLDNVLGVCLLPNLVVEGSDSPSSKSKSLLDDFLDDWSFNGASVLVASSGFWGGRRPGKFNVQLSSKKSLLSRSKTHSLV